MTQLFTFLCLLMAGFVFGRIAEARHFARLAAGEAALQDVTLTTTQSFDHMACAHTGLVSGNVVVANDYFKTITAGIKTIFGGRLRSYESMLERARREAVLRMRQDARDRGYRAVVNVRLDFSVIQGKRANVAGSFEVLATGTGLGA